MSFEEQLRNWLNYFYATRGIGHTRLAERAIQGSETGMLICANEHHSNQSIVRTAHLGTIMNGKRVPVLFDNFAIIDILERSLNERIDKQKVREIIDKIENEWTTTYKESDFDMSMFPTILKKELGL